MLLAIDCGNTTTVFAVMDGDTERGNWRASTDPGRTADEYSVWLTHLMARSGLDGSDIDGVIIATVVPNAREALTRLAEDEFGITPLVVGDANVRLGLKNLMDRPEDAGADRLVNAVGAHSRHPGDLIVVDFGTATTFDVVDAAGNYRGGVIAPGINLSGEALHMAAALLPRVSVRKPERIIGSSTVAAMQSGIFWGYVSMIEGMVARIQQEYGAHMRVIATGGLAPLFVDATDDIDVVDADVTVRGLVEIYRRSTAA